MARTDPQINFRLPANLKARLDADALRNKRTLTAEIVARLQESSDIASIRQQLKTARRNVNYSTMQFNLNLLRHVAQMVVEETPTCSRKTPSMKLLQKALAIPIPSDLQISNMKEEIDEKSLQQVIDDINESVAIVRKLDS